MIVHRTATRDLSSEAFLSNLIAVPRFAHQPVARVINKPLLANADAMAERSASFAGYMYVFWRKLPTLTWSRSSFPISM
jgi:hypothetical protein